MKRIHKIVAGAAGALALVAVTAVVAAPAMGGCEGMGMMHGGMHAMRGGEPGAMAEKHLADLKTQLKITAQQEPAWQAFAAKATERAKAMQSLQAQHTSATDAKTAAPDRMAQHIDAMKQHLAGMETMQVALKDLYAVLTPEQRTVADQHASRMGGHGHGMGPGQRG
jgi:protein CpxP